MRAPRPYLDRNKDIVRETNLLVAALAEAVEQLRFWHLVNCAGCAPAWTARLPIDAMMRPFSVVPSRDLVVGHADDIACGESI